jgi:hypothetical protein
MTWIPMVLLGICTALVAYSLGRDFRNQKIQDLQEEVEEKEQLIKVLAVELRKATAKYEYIINELKKGKNGKT